MRMMDATSGVVMRTLGAAGALLVVLAAATPSAAVAQTMPGPVYHDLANKGHERLAKRISKKLELRAHPDDEDVASLLDLWEREEGGPDTGYDWLAVTRLWLRAGDAARAEMALHRADESGEVTEGELLLDQARVAFLSGQPDLAIEAYWRGCKVAAEAASIEYWLDVEVLATPYEAEQWDRFRRLPVGQRDLCAFLRRLWNQRALASAIAVGARIRDHYVRMRLALDQYRRRGGKKGPTFVNSLGRPTNAAFDDRGLIYLRMGNPDRVTTYAGNPSIGQHNVSAECYQPNVSWAYDYPDGTRVFHFTSFGGLDDYWLIENLGLVYRCGDPAAVIAGDHTGQLTPVNESRFVVLAPWASLVLQDLYRSRQGLDPRYAMLAQQMDDQSGVLFDASGRVEQASVGSEALEAQRSLQQEREWTWDDGEFAVASVPDRPDVATNTRMLFEELQFRASRPALSRVWLNGVIEAENLTPTIQTDGSYLYRVDARWVLLDESGAFHRFTSTVQTASPRLLGADESIPVRLAAELPPGVYRYNVLVQSAMAAPREKKRAGNYKRAELTVRDFEIGAPVLSDIAVAADSGGSWSPGAGVKLRASPAHFTGPDGAAFVYFEAYNLTPGGTYVTRVRLEPEEDGEAFDLSFPGDVPGNGSVTRRMLRLDLDQTDPGRYRMEVTVLDEGSGNTTLPFNTRITVHRSG
jgi:hypothetical protein